MKKLLFGLLFSAAASAPAFGQITLEHTYYTTNNVNTIRVSETEYKIVDKEYGKDVVTIYSSDHKLEKSISFSQYRSFELIQISKYTFDLDDEYEFLFRATEPDSLYPSVYVTEEDGTEIFKSEKGYYGSVYSTGNQAKLILHNETSNNCKVYSLVGKLYTSVPESKKEDCDVTAAYPNPAFGQINITHGISSGQKAEVKVYNMSGQVVSTTSFGTAQPTLSLSTAGLPAGTYLYVITSGSEVKKGEFLIGG